MIRALLVWLLASSPAFAERVEVLGGHFSLELPAGHATTETPDGLPAGYTRTQLRRMDAEGRELPGIRPVILRHVIYRPDEARAAWPQQYHLHPDPAGASDAELLELTETEGFFADREGVPSRPLRLNERGTDWWGIDPATALLLGFFAPAPSLRACTRQAAEVLCVHMALPEGTTARGLGLGTGPALEPDGLVALAATPEAQAARALAASLRPTAAYLPCCRR